MNNKNSKIKELFKNKQFLISMAIVVGLIVVGVLQFVFR